MENERYPRWGHQRVRKAVVALAAAALIFAGGGSLSSISASAEQVSPESGQTTAAQPTEAATTNVPSPATSGPTGEVVDSSDPAGPDRTIVSFEELEPIVGVAGDEELTLPEKVVAHFRDNTTQKVDVTWSGQDNQPVIDVTTLDAGSYTLLGTVKGSKLKAKLNVELTKPELAARANELEEPEKASEPGEGTEGENLAEAAEAEKSEAPQAGGEAEPEVDEVDPGAPMRVAPAPENGLEETESGDEESEDGEEAEPTDEDGSEGEGGQTSEEPTIVTVKDIDYGSRPVGIDVNVEYKYVEVEYSDGTFDWVQPDWEKETVSSDKAGAVTITGRIEGTDRKAQLTVNFLAIKSIENPEIYTAPGQRPLSLPNVEIELTDGYTSTYTVQWEELNWSSTHASDELTMKGTIEDSKLTTTANVFVRAVGSVDPVTVSAYVNKNVDLPSRVTVKFDEDHSTDMSVRWNVEDRYSLKYPKVGNYKVQGTVTGTDQSVTATIDVVSVDSFEEIQVKTAQGFAPNLPWIVTATLSNKNTADLQVTWDDIQPAQYAKTGTFTVDGTVSETDEKVSATVTVLEMKTVEAASVTTFPGKEPDIYGGVTIVLSDDSTQEMSVAWDQVKPEQYAEAGSFKVAGFVLDSDNKPTDIKATMTVNVSEIREVDTGTTYTIPGEAPVLSDSVRVTLSDGTSMSSQVTWDSIDPKEYAEANAFTVKGTVEGTDILAVEEIRVVPFASAVEQSLSVLAGSGERLPSSVQVMYADGNSTYRDVDWEPVGEDKWATQGRFDVTGTVVGTDFKALIHVTVADLAQTKFSTQTLVGDAPTTSFNAQLTDGSTTYIDPDWEPITPKQYAAPGTFDVKGKLENSDAELTLHVSVVAVDHIQPLTPVTTVTGSLPDLPYGVTVVLNDQTTERYSVDWPAVAQKQYQDAGSFKVTGRVRAIDQPVTVTVNVLESQKIQNVTVSTLRGFAPHLPYTVAATLWDGSTQDVRVQWETPDPASYANKGTSFTVKGFLLGSDIPVTANVNVYDIASTVVATENTLVGQAPTLTFGLYGGRVMLSNGEDYFLDSSIQWDQVDPAQYEKAGEYNVNGKFLGKDLKVTTHVKVGQFTKVQEQYDPYQMTHLAGSSDPVNLPDQVAVYLTTGELVWAPVTWQTYDQKLLDKAGSTITVEGNVVSASGPDVTTRITVVGLESVEAPNDIVMFIGGILTLPGQVQGHYTNGELAVVPVLWDQVDGSKYAQAGDFTVKGKAGNFKDKAQDGKDVSVEVHVVGDVESIDPVAVWTIPGVAPSLPDTVTVNYPKSVLDKIGDWFSGDSDQDGSGKPTLSVTWNAIDPAQYAKDGKKFTVNGTVAGSQKKATATVSVAQITDVKVPSVTTVPKVHPTLPSQISVTTSDGQTREVDAQWNTIAQGAYQKPNVKFTAAGQLVVWGPQGATELAPIQTTVYVSDIASLVPAALPDVTTEVGEYPKLPSTLPVQTENGTVTDVYIDWDEIPEASLNKEGTFNATGHVGFTEEGEPQGMPVTVEVTVIQKQKEPQVSYVDVTVNSTITGNKLDLPDKASVFMSDGSWQSRDVTWDDSDVDYNKAGTYTFTGKVDDTDKVATYIMNVLDSAAITMTGLEPVNVQVKTGSTPQEVNQSLPQKVTVSYSNGAKKLVDVNWNLTNVTADQLKTVGSTIDITGTVANTVTPAKATIHVVDAAKVPNPVQPLTISMVEGVAPVLPDTIKLTYPDGTEADSGVTWDESSSDQWAVGTAGQTFTVTGVTTTGGLTVTANVTVTKLAVKTMSATTSRSTYQVGSTFDPSTVTVTATSKDGTTVTLPTSAYTLSNTTLNQVGTQTVTVTLTSDPTITTTFTVTVTKDAVKPTPEPTKTKEPSPEPNKSEEPTVEPTEPGGASNPSTPTKPTTGPTTKPTTAPTTGPTTPGGTTNPSSSSQSGEPTTPVQPTEPGTTAKPTASAEPTTPGKPGQKPTPSPTGTSGAAGTTGTSGTVGKWVGDDLDNTGGTGSQLNGIDAHGQGGNVGTDNSKGLDNAGQAGQIKATAPGTTAGNNGHNTGNANPQSNTTVGHHNGAATSPRSGLVQTGATVGGLTTLAGVLAAAGIALYLRQSGRRDTSRRRPHAQHLR